MHGQGQRVALRGFGVVFGVLFLVLTLANAKPGAEIKLPPLRVRVGEKAPDFALPDASGQTVRLSDFRGRNVLIDFYRGYW